MTNAKWNAHRSDVHAKHRQMFKYVYVYVCIYDIICTYIGTFR